MAETEKSEVEDGRTCEGFFFISTGSSRVSKQIKPEQVKSSDKIIN